jgi:subtilisin family serine protease
MQNRFRLAFSPVLLCGLTALAAATSQSSPTTRPGSRAAAMRGGATLHAFGTRAASLPGVPASRLDGSLNDLARHAARTGAGYQVTDLQALMPAARFRQLATDQEPLVLVDAITRGDPRQLEARLVAFGMQGAAIYSNDVGGWLPVSQLQAAASSTEVHAIRAALAHARAGAVTSQGDFAQRSDVIRTTYPAITGAGVTVGVLSDSFNCYAVYAANGVPATGNQGYAYYSYLGPTYLADDASDVATGDLPATVSILAEPYTSSPSATGNCLDYGAPQYLPFTDEGRAMSQIVHDVAPGANLAFYTADNSEANFANGIVDLAAAGAKVEVDDTGYYDEPFYQDGLLAQAVNTVEAQGVAYFSSAGNDGTTSYENTAPSFATLSSSGQTAGQYLLNFDTSGASVSTSLPITIPALYPGEYVAIVVQWDQPFVTGAPGSPGATSQLNLCYGGLTGGDVIADNDGNTTSCSGLNTIGQDPVQLLTIGNPANASGNTSQTQLQFTLGLANGTPAPGRVILSLESDGYGSIDAFATHSATIQGHPNATGAMAVGAAFFAQTPLCGTTPAVLESYSSQGGAPILFDTVGNRLSAPILRTKPDIVGPDGTNTTFFGYPLSDSGQTDASSVTDCQNHSSYPSFFGTSAAAPHVAAVAALMLQANASLTPSQIYSALRSSASPMSATVPDDASGWGFVQADMALAAAGGPASVTGSSSSSSGAVSTTTTSAASHGGGGAFDAYSLAALAAFAGMIIIRRRAA